MIVGGGFAGVACAQLLAEEDRARVTLIDQSGYHQFQPLLYQVATAELADAGRRSFWTRPRLSSREYIGDSPTRTLGARNDSLCEDHNGWSPTEVPAAAHLVVAFGVDQHSKEGSALAVPGVNIAMLLIGETASLSIQRWRNSQPAIELKPAPHTRKEGA